MLEILSRNRERLLEFMSKFHQDNDNEQVAISFLHFFPIADVLCFLFQFAEDRAHIIEEIQQLPPFAALQSP